jgi:two-component sensor histidine kinase
MYNRKQYSLAAAGLVITLVGLAALLIVPLAVGARLKSDFDKIDRLERSRQAINEATEVAQESDTFLMHRYAVPGATGGRFDAQSEYRALLAAWRTSIANPDVVAPLDKTGREAWERGAAAITRWIEGYLSLYVGNGNPGGADNLEKQEGQFRDGLAALARARSAAALQEDELHRKQQWLNSAQTTVIAPMAIICFALAFLAWTNVRTLQQAWMREREAASHLKVVVRESNHRIKNNLQVISALIDMQIQDPGDTVPKSSLEDIVHQVRAVAAVHDFFSHELKSDRVQADQMLRRLIDLCATPIGLRVDLQTEAIELAVKQATAVALITNELLLNSGKHGATEARVVMSMADSAAILRVSDNGPGFPVDFDVIKNSNLGLTLVDTLTRHDLQGHLLFDNDNGARVEVTFPLAAAS